MSQILVELVKLANLLIILSRAFASLDRECESDFCIRAIHGNWKNRYEEKKDTPILVSLKIHRLSIMVQEKRRSIIWFCGEKWNDRRDRRYKSGKRALFVSLIADYIMIWHRKYSIPWRLTRKIKNQIYPRKDRICSHQKASLFMKEA